MSPNKQTVILFSALGAILLGAALFPQPSLFPSEPAAIIDPEVSARANARYRAGESCRDAILRVATNQSSIRFQPDAVISGMVGSGFTVIWRLSGKNAYGSESVRLAQCQIAADGTTVTQVDSVDYR